MLLRRTTLASRCRTSILGELTLSSISLNSETMSASGMIQQRALCRMNDLQVHGRDVEGSAWLCKTPRDNPVTSPPSTRTHFSLLGALYHPFLPSAGMRRVTVTETGRFTVAIRFSALGAHLVTRSCAIEFDRIRLRLHSTPASSDNV